MIIEPLQFGAFSILGDHGMRTEKIIFVFALMLFELSNTKSVHAQEYAIKQFTIDDGLPSSHVYEVKQDSKGFYWIATSEGLVRYDGYKIEQVGEGNNPFNRDIWWSYEDSKGRIWGLGRGTRLWYFEADTFGFMDLKINKSLVEPSFRKIGKSTTFNKLIEDNHGQYWLTQGGKLFGHNQDQKKTSIHYQHTANAPKAIPSLFQDENNNSYLIYKTPIATYSLEKRMLTKLKYEYPQNIFYKDYQTKNMSLWNENNTTFICPSQDTLYTIFNGNLTSYIKGNQSDLGQFPSSNLLNEISYRVISLKKSYAFLHSNGNFFTDKNFSHIPSLDVLKDFKINTIYEDYEGGLWISTTDKGLIYLRQASLAAKNYYERADMNSAVVAIERSKKNEIWIGFKNGTICKRKNGEIIKYYLKPKKNIDKTWSLHNMIITGDHLTFVVGDFELHIGDIKDDVNLIKTRLMDEWEAIKNINKGADNKIYITDYACNFSLEINANNSINITDIGGEKVLASTKDEDGNLILSNYDGLYRSDFNNNLTLLSSDVIARKFEFDSHHSVWAIHNSRGISKIEMDSTTPIQTLATYLIKDIFFEADSVLWAATSQGLIQLKFNLSTNSYVYQRKITSANGLPTNDITAIHTDKNNLYVGTSKGLTIIDRSKLFHRKKGTNVILKNAYSKGEKLDIKKDLNLEPDQNSITFNYVYISPKSAGQISYQYMLKGIDDDWQETQETSLTYPFLPAGNYSFLLKATDINGIPSANNINLNINIQQYWWKTTTFITCIALLALAITILLFRIRLHQIKNREAERSLIDKRMAELKLSALQTQMNPHFVFNVLNSIQESFLAQNTLEANKYLSDFSKLMRLFLESSNHRNITLNKEIRLLTYYIELEQMRLKNGFEFDFQFDDNIETDEMFIPTMLLQPIIENAILHGLKYMDNKGKLTIKFSAGLTNGKLLVSIEDNGIGRKKSEEINARRKKNHVSMAGGIIAERLELINAGENDFISMKTIDLIENEISCGTRVELTMDLQINRNPKNQ